MMTRLIKIILPLAVVGLLGGCGSQSKSHSDTSSKATSSKVAKRSTSESSSSESLQSSQSSSARSQSSANSSSERVSSNATSVTRSARRSSQATTKATPAVNQKTIASRISRLLSNQYAPQDLTMQFTQSAYGTYTVQVQENHQSANMRARGADPNTSPTIAWFKTNTQGQLLKSVDGGATYQVVGNAY